MHSNSNIEFSPSTKSQPYWRSAERQRRKAMEVATRRKRQRGMSSAGMTICLLIAMTVVLLAGGCTGLHVQCEADREPLPVYPNSHRH